MLFIKKITNSSIGQKSLVAITGIMLALFLIAHMSGNLLIFVGPDALNSYAATLQNLHILGIIPGMVWIVRLGLLFTFIIHVVFTIRLTRKNRQARRIQYQQQNLVKSSFAAQHIVASGGVILAFVIYHILHFTVGAIQPEYSGQMDHLGRPDVYRMVVAGFNFQHQLFGLNLPLVALSYLVAMAALALHLLHVIASLFQTLGLARHRSYHHLRKFAFGFVIFVCSGFSAVPIAILLGVVN